MKTLVSLMALVGVLGLVVGCTESDEEAAQTPEGAATVENTAVQTDDEGNTIEAPATAGGEAVPPQEPDTGQEALPGDVDAGQQVFAANCTSCHLSDGQEGGGVGPQLAGQGLEQDYIRETIENGRGAMPGGLVSGEDLNNAVAYVLSLQ